MQVYKCMLKVFSAITLINMLIDQSWIDRDILTGVVVELTEILTGIFWLE